MHCKQKESACSLTENGVFFEFSTATALSWLRNTSRLFVPGSTVGKRSAFGAFFEAQPGEARAAA
jgi:hypothetical protein